MVQSMAHLAEGPEALDQRRTEDEQKHGWQHQEDQRKEDLDRGLLRHLFRLQAPGGAQRVGGGTQCRRDLSADLLALNQSGGEGLYVLNPGALGPGAQRLPQRRASQHLTRDLREFFADGFFVALGFGANHADRFLQSHPRFDRNDQQVKRVGQIARNGSLTPAGAGGQVVGGHEKPQYGAGGDEDGDNRLVDGKANNQSEQGPRNGAAQANYRVDAHCIRTGKAGLQQQLRQLFGARRVHLRSG